MMREMFLLGSYVVRTLLDNRNYWSGEKQPQFVELWCELNM